MRNNISRLPDGRIDYYDLLKSLNSREKTFLTTIHVIRLFAVVAIILSITSSVWNTVQTSHVPVSPATLSAETSETGEAQYDISYRSDKVVSGSNTYLVTCGGDTTVWTDADIAKIGSDTAINTRIYRLKIKMNDRYLFDFINGRSVTFVRYSFLGQNQFSDAEIEEYKQKAAEYFTYRKFSLMKYEDADTHYIVIPEMDQ